MERKEPAEVMPMIRAFHRGVGGIIKRGVYDKTGRGRPHDALIYILYGTTLYTFSDYTVTAKAGDLLYLPRGSVYSMDVQSDHYDFLYADFDFEVPEGITLQSAALPAADGKNTENLFHRMLAIWYIRRDTAVTDCLSLLYAIYSDFIRAAHTASYIPPDKRRRLEDSLRYIDAHLADKDLTVEAVAAAVCMSESYFRKMFTAAYKFPPVRYIRMTRMMQARQKLRYSDIPISEIAESLGFSSLYYFSHAFRSDHGCTPSEYRRRYSPYPAT